MASANNNRGRVFLKAVVVVGVMCIAIFSAGLLPEAGAPVRVGFATLLSRLPAAESGLQGRYSGNSSYSYIALAEETNWEKVPDFWYTGFRDRINSKPELAKKSFEIGYNLDMQKSSFYEVLERYTASGEITEIKPGGLDAVKESVAHGGKPVLIAYVDDNYSTSFRHKHIGILAKNLFELCGGREGKIDVYFKRFNITPGYSNGESYQPGHEADEEGVTDAPTLEVIIKDGKGKVIKDTIPGAPDSKMELYEVLADPNSSIYLVNWVINNANPDKTFNILYKNTITPTRVPINK